MTEDILLKLSKEIEEYKKDTNRPVVFLSNLVLELATMYGEAKRDYVKYKTSYEVGMINKKEEREIQLAKEGIEKTPSDAELKRYAEKEMKDTFKKYKEAKEIAEYLQPIYDSYTNHINSIKFDRKELIKADSLMNNHNEF